MTRGRKLVLCVVLVFGMLASIYVSLALYPAESAEERQFNAALDRFLASADSEIAAVDLIPGDWRSICALPNYATLDKYSRATGSSSSTVDFLRWEFYWASTDAFFGYAIDRKDGGVLPIKIWHISGVYSDEWEVKCFSRGNAWIHRMDREIKLGNKEDRFAPKLKANQE